MEDLINATEATVIKPTWLTPLRDQLESRGLLHENDAWADASEALFELLTKLQVESLRKARPLMSGYQLWLLTDYCEKRCLRRPARVPS